MGKLERITVTLPEKMAAGLRDRVAAGDYATTSEIVRDALRGWCDKQDRRRAAAESLSQLIAEGEQGPFRDGDEFFDALESRLQKLIDDKPDAG
jgi:antitoxin ParD1/3/4